MNIKTHLRSAALPHEPSNLIFRADIPLDFTYVTVTVCHASQGSMFLKIARHHAKKQPCLPPFTVRASTHLCDAVKLIEIC